MHRFFIRTKIEEIPAWPGQAPVPNKVPPLSVKYV